MHVSRSDLPHTRAYVTPIRMHFDPVAIVTDKSEITVVYRLAAIDLLRLKSGLSSLNKCGLILVKRKDGRYRFLTFKEIVVSIFPGFKEVIDEIGLSCSYDFQVKDVSKASDYGWLTRMITLKEDKRLEAQNRRRLIRLKIQSSRVGTVIGPESIGIIEDLMWATYAFEPLHAITLMAKTDPISLDVSSLLNELRKTGCDLRQIPNSKNRILVRKKPTITLMDCAEFLFPSKYYFEAESSKLSGVLRMPVHKLPSHFRGYLIVNDDYISMLRSTSITRPD